MMHAKRRMSVKMYESAEALFEDFRRCRTWCLCNGFGVGDYLMLNDSTCEDAIQEYAV